MKPVLLLVITLMLCSQADATSLRLETHEQKELATRINAASNELSESVMQCIEVNDGKMTGCTCESRAACPFKTEFDTFVKAYCDAVKEFPEWKNEILFWQVEGDITGYNLATNNIEMQYGQYCE